MVYLQSAETRLTMIEVDVEELWTMTVTRRPTMTPPTGFVMAGLSFINPLADFPATNRKLTFNRSNEQTKR